MGPFFDIWAGTPDEARKYTQEHRLEANHYTQIDGEIFHRGFTSPLLRCVTPGEYEGVMAEVHEGICASHIRGNSLVNKVLRARFYWPALRRDCFNMRKGMKNVKCLLTY